VPNELYVYDLHDVTARSLIDTRKGCPKCGQRVSEVVYDHQLRLAIRASFVCLDCAVYAPARWLSR
jgi:ribosomal protein S27AE